MLYPLFLILALLIFALVMVVVSMRGRGRNLRPVVVSPDAARNHRALIYLIRGTGVLVASAAALAAIYFSLHCFLDALRGEMGTLGWPGVFIAIGIIAGVLGVISHAGYGMWLWVDTTSVANFAFVFAMLLAVGWYHLLPANLPKAVIDYFGDNPFFAPFRESNPNPSYKAALSYLAFFVFYKLIKAFVVQKLRMNAVVPPKEPPFSGSSGPFVPFNPYDLSQNKPVLPLPKS
jgi:hypothetical protein